MKVTICMGAKCTLMGADAIYDAVEYLKDNLDELDIETKPVSQVEVEFAHCLEYCKKIHKEEVAPVVVIDDEVILRATAQEVSEKIVDRLAV